MRNGVSHHDALDILESVNDNNNRLAEYTYYPDGTIRSLRHGSLYTEYSYDADRNLIGLKTMLGDEVLADDHYLYDHNGNRTERQQPGGATRYTYDDLNQLTKVEYPSYTEQLYYDKAGNRRRRVSGGTVEDYRYDPAGHLTEYTKGGRTTTFTYDKAGNLTADDKARYTYDLFNRTEKVETFDGHVQINHYDAEGLRSGIEEDGRLVQFIFRDQEVVTELEKDKGMTRYIRGYDLIASDADCARTYYHYASDELGSITHVVAGEEILDHYEYDAWGNLTRCEETVENRFKFNGQQYDPISQQYYLRARYYNPVIGRFTQEDTYRGDGLNLYAYCQNNPVYYVDPSGYYRNCVKDAYDRIRKENPGMSAQDAYNLALKETGKDRIPNDAAQNTEQNRPQNLEPENPDNRNRQDSESGKPVQSDTGKETDLFLPEEYYQKIDENIARVIAARDAEVARIQTLSKTQQSYIATVVAGVDLRTGDIYVGVKDSRVYRGNATCAEDIVFRGLGGNTNANIIMTPAIRPRNNVVIPVCPRCQTKYPQNQFVRGTTFQ